MTKYYGKREEIRQTRHAQFLKLAEGDEFANDVHKMKVRSQAGAYMAVCGCGWTSKQWRESIAAADADMLGKHWIPS